MLVVRGAPGTGKARLMRANLGEMSRRKGGDAQALYTGHKQALGSDEVFVKFITGWDDAFVVEDALLSTAERDALLLKLGAGAAARHAQASGSCAAKASLAEVHQAVGRAAGA